jgi:hypothetical protein
MKKLLKYKLVAVLAAVLLLLLAVTVAYAHGHTSDQLVRAGRTCIPAGPNNWIHCFPSTIDFPVDLVNGVPATVQVKVFTNPADTNEEQSFLGTELLIREDLFERGLGEQRPCAPDPHGEEPGTYHHLGFAPYYACHNFDTPQ